MKSAVILFLSVCTLCACNNGKAPEGDNNNKVPAAGGGFFVTVDGYDLTDTTTQLFLTYADKEIIRLNCKTNLPVNTRIVVQKGLRINRTSADAEKSYSADTITVNNPGFVVSFAPRLMGGYVNFSVWPDMQPEALRKELAQRDTARTDLVYYSEYGIDYKKSTPAGSSVAIPDVPFKLVIEKQ